MPFEYRIRITRDPVLSSRHILPGVGTGSRGAEASLTAHLVLV